MLARIFSLEADTFPDLLATQPHILKLVCIYQLASNLEDQSEQAIIVGSLLF